MKRAIDFQIGNVVGCLLTHSHLDHCGRIKDYLHSAIKVYSSDEVSADILTVAGEKTIALSRMKRHRISGFDVVPFRVPHNETECDGWLIEHCEFGRLLFITDAEYCPKKLLKYGVSTMRWLSATTQKIMLLKRRTEGMCFLAIWSCRRANGL